MRLDFYKLKNIYVGEKMREWILSHKKVIGVLSIVFLIGVPIMVYGLSVIPVFPVGGNNDWAGFWGGYLGAILGVIGSIFIMNGTLKEERKKQEEEKKIQYCNYIVENIASFFETVSLFLIWTNKCREIKRKYKIQDLEPEDKRS